MDKGPRLLGAAYYQKKENKEPKILYLICCSFVSLLTEILTFKRTEMSNLGAIYSEQEYIYLKNY